MQFYLKHLKFKLDWLQCMRFGVHINLEWLENVGIVLYYSCGNMLIYRTVLNYEKIANLYY